MEKEKTENIDDGSCEKKYKKRGVKDFNTFRVFFQFLVTKIIYGFSYHVIYRLEVHGKENIPKENNYVVAGNHLSTLDPPLLCNVLNHPVAFMAKQELFRHPQLKIMLDWLGVFAVNRDSLEVSTIKSAMSVVKTKKWVLGLFPQGTREKAGEIHHVTRGFVGLAKATKCDILPIGITGTDKPKKWPFTGKIIVNIGPVIKLTDNQDEMVEQWIKSVEKLTGFKYVGEEETK